MKKNIKQFFAIILSLIITVVFMTLTYLLPYDNIHDHAAASVDYIKEHLVGRNEVNYLFGTIQPDYYTDSVILHLAAYESDKAPFEAAMYNSYRSIVEREEQGFINYMASIRDVGFEYQEVPESSYGRIWASTASVFKILLLFFNYQEIRIINYLAMALSIAFLGLYILKTKKEYFAPYIFMVALLNPVLLTKNIAYSTNFYFILFNIFILFYLANNKEKEEAKSASFIVSSVIGAMVCCYDLLSYPLATLSIPMLFFLSLNNSKENTVKENIENLIKYVLSWGLGYCLSWVVKWFLYVYVSGDYLNVIKQILMRCSNKTEVGLHIGYIKVLQVNFYRWFLASGFIYVIAFFFYFLFNKWIRKAGDKETHHYWLLLVNPFVTLIYSILLLCKKLKIRYSEQNAVYFIAALAPFAWTFLIKNHSFIHSFFVFRIFYTATLAITFYIFDSRYSLSE